MYIYIYIYIYVGRSYYSYYVKVIIYIYIYIYTQYMLLVGTRHFIRLMSILICFTLLMETHADAHILELNFH